MNEVWKIMDAVRGAVGADELPILLMMEASRKLGNTPELRGNASQAWQKFSVEKSYPQLQAAAQTLLALSPRDRLAALNVVFENCHRGRMGDHLWIALPAAEQIAQMILAGDSVRCSFAWSLHPALHIGVKAAETGRKIEISFIDPNSNVCDIAALAAAALELDLIVIHGRPLDRVDGIEAEAEITFPPFSAKLDDSDTLPRKTLEWLGATQSGRLTAEPVAIADILANAPKTQAIIGLSAGALFRMVGVEVAAREELINTGRLEAVFDVPSGMIYRETGINTALLVVAPTGSERDSVRFVDLADDHFSARSSRGRYEARIDTFWADVLAPSAPETDYVIDVSLTEIDALGGVLTPSRFLSRTSAKISAFNKDYEVRELADLAELIRPVALPKGEEGDFVVHEAAPGDVGENGFLIKPPKTTVVDRGGLRKARNQQLEPGDLVISVKGTIGRVGLVPEDIPDRNADAFWAAGQSMMILRPRRNLIAPEVLYEYLSSNLMHEHLNTLAGGAVIQAFNMKDLKALTIPVPSNNDQDSICEEFALRQSAFKELELIRRQIGALKAKSWPHRDIEM